MRTFFLCFVLSIVLSAAGWAASDVFEVTPENIDTFGYKFTVEAKQGGATAFFKIIIEPKTKDTYWTKNLGTTLSISDGEKAVIGCCIEARKENRKVETSEFEVNVHYLEKGTFMFSVGDEEMPSAMFFTFNLKKFLDRK